MAQLVDSLPGIRDISGSVSTTTSVAHPSEVEPGRWSQGHQRAGASEVRVLFSCVVSEVVASMGYMRPCLRGLWWIAGNVARPDCASL